MNALCFILLTLTIFAPIQKVWGSGAVPAKDKAKDKDKEDDARPIIPGNTTQEEVEVEDGPAVPGYTGFWRRRPGTDKDYLVPDIKLICAGAEGYCEQRSAKLITINDRQDRDYVKNITNHLGPNVTRILIGLFKPLNKEANPLKWRDGSVYPQYELDWVGQEMPQFQTEQCYCVIQRLDKLWNATDCYLQPYYFICERPSNICDNIECDNGGRCQESNETDFGYECNCTEEWVGQQCKTDVDECSVPKVTESPCKDVDKCNASKVSEPPCKNNGTCSNTPGGFNCTCRAGFTGNACEYKMNHAEHYDQLVRHGAHWLNNRLMMLQQAMWV